MIFLAKGRGALFPLTFLAAVIVLAPGIAGGAPAALPGRTNAATILLPPPTTGEPVRVRVGLYILNLVALDEVEQTFTCTGYLTETWSDPRLAFRPEPGDSPWRYYHKNDIWFPLLQFDNSTAPRAIAGFLLRGDSAGGIHYVEKFSVRLSSNMHLRSFPFDTQQLQIYVHPFTAQEKHVMLTADPKSTGISPAAYTPLPLWDLGGVTYRSVTGLPEEGDAAPSHFVFGIQIRRHSEYYIFRIFLPLVLMVAISWGVLWIPPTDLNSQLMISVTTVLTVVAFSVAVANVLPPVPYVTFYDSFFLVCFLFILLTIGEAIVVHTMYGTNRSKALKLRALTRRLFLPLFLVCASLMSVIFLRA